MKLVIIAAAALFAAQAHADPLELVCSGEAIKTDQQASFGSMTTSDGRSATGSMTSYRKVRSDERLRLKIDEAGGATIKLPPNLVPPIHTGGQDNWWPVTDFTMTDALISGSYRLNVLNKGHFTIDRHTGDIDARALAMKFTGECEKAAEAPDERKF